MVGSSSEEVRAIEEDRELHEFGWLQSYRSEIEPSAGAVDHVTETGYLHGKHECEGQGENRSYQDSCALVGQPYSAEQHAPPRLAHKSCLRK